MSTRGERAARRDALRQQQEQETAQLQRKTGHRERAKTVHYAIRLREASAFRIIPRPTGTPNLCWGSVFVNLLRNVLGNEPYWNDLRIIDDSGEEDQHVVIRSRSEPETVPFVGNTTGRLRIDLNYNLPSFGFSNDSHQAFVNNWSKDCRSKRNVRISLRPLDEFIHWVQPMPLPPGASEGRVRRFADFTEWNHGVYQVANPVRLAVFHDDYNFSYPVIQIVARAIREHHRRMAGGMAPHIAIGPA